MATKADRGCVLLGPGGEGGLLQDDLPGGDGAGGHQVAPHRGGAHQLEGPAGGPVVGPHVPLVVPGAVVGGVTATTGEGGGGQALGGPAGGRGQGQLGGQQPP